VGCLRSPGTPFGGRQCAGARAPSAVDDGDIADPKRSFFSNEMRSEGIVEIVSVILDDLGRGC
jgi:hypothetical protein